MSTRFCFTLFFMLLLPTFELRAQDVNTQYLKLQDAYTLRVQDIELRYQKQQRELLNRFILALVRVEQDFRDNGDLEGVVFCRELREHALINGTFPEQPEDSPAKIAEMFATLDAKYAEGLQTHQQELNAFNHKLFQALEPYQAEFARQDLIPQAEEIQDLRAALNAALEHQHSLSGQASEVSTSHSHNPNDYPFALEASIYSQIRGIIPRNCKFPLRIEEQDAVTQTPTGYSFTHGRLSIPSSQSAALIEDLQRNRMITIELAFQPIFDFQGYEANPTIIFQFGETLETANAAITLEGKHIWLYFRTKIPPADRANHRYKIANLQGMKNVHIEVTYRTGELTIYLNGTATLRLRNEVTGPIDVWEEAPIYIGNAQPDSPLPFTLPFRGTLNHLYIKAGDSGSRQVTSDYNRYLNFLESQ